MNITAYIVGDTADMPLISAGPQRRWMDETDRKFAYRCLPLVMANQAGWYIPSPCDFFAGWDGGPRIDCTAVVCPNHPKGRDPRISSHFGYGVLTFAIPYLFRTPPSINLLVKGPTNEPKDGIFALEGIVETDWSVATFTMNWVFTRPGEVKFTKGEPICMVIPVQRGLAEGLTPLIDPIGNAPELQKEYWAFRNSRDAFNRDLHDPKSEAARRGWQRDYFKGKSTSGQVEAEEHQTKIQLAEFRVA